MTLTIYNMLGQRVRTFSMQSMPAGYHSVTWDATNVGVSFINKKAPVRRLFEPEATAFSLRESFARRHGRVGDFLPNDRSRAPKVQGGVNGYLSVM